MPLYEYSCSDCGAKDHRIGAIDDNCAICHKCGGLMMRLDDPFQVLLWDEVKKKEAIP